jgi:hypothetical protein
LREFIISPQQKPEQAPAGGAAPTVILPDGTAQYRPKAPVRQRDFMVRYDGRFIGHYRAIRPMTPRVAFGQVAREMRAQRLDFNPELLALYRPVKLRVKGYAGAEVAAAGGAFLWFEKK